mgnify:FL=1|tara:strand:- start:344 stop:985 length:642 start_codon:yes stop_codon:yes gene_type:complete
MNDDDKALLRLNTMSDWIELNPGFKKDKLLEELKPFENDWKKYNPKKPNNRFGLSVTSIDGGLHGIPDLTSLRDWEIQTGEQIHNHDLNVPTDVYKNCPTLQAILEPWKPWLGRCHFLRMDRGSFFPEHFDINKEDYSYDEVRFIGFVKCNEYDFKWIYDDRVIKGNQGTLWYFNGNKRHSVFSFKDGIILLVMCLKFDKDLFQKMLEYGKVK